MSKYLGLALSSFQFLRLAANLVKGGLEGK